MTIGKHLSNPNKMVSTVIFLVVGLLVLVALLPTLITSIINLSTVPNFAFASFFSSGGVVLIVLSASVLLGIIGIFLKKSGR